jgi:hypothetical protein
MSSSRNRVWIASLLLACAACMDPTGPQTGPQTRPQQKPSCQSQSKIVRWELLPNAAPMQAALLAATGYTSCVAIAPIVIDGWTYRQSVCTKPCN